MQNQPPQIRKIYIPEIPDHSPAPVPVHVERHPRCEILCQFSGSSHYFLNGEDLVLSAGDCCLISPWIPHQNGFRQNDSEGEQLWLHAHQMTFGIVHHDADGSFRYVTKGRLPQEYTVLLKRQENEYRNDHDTERIRVFFSLLLKELELELKRPDRSEPGIADNLQHIIRSRNGVNCSLAELERRTGYSRSHISHLFRQTCGMTIGTYINMVRLDFTREALAYGMTQKEISGELGFSSPAAFWQWYRKFR